MGKRADAENGAIIGRMPPPRAYRAGNRSKIIAARAKRIASTPSWRPTAPAGPIRVVCGYCRSEHNYRAGPRLDAPGAASLLHRATSPLEPARDPRLPRPRARALPHRQRARKDRSRHVSRCPSRSRAVASSRHSRRDWHLSGDARGEVARRHFVLRPGTQGLQEKSWPIETFFHKVVMLRNRLRTLEQQLNASDLPDDVKVKLQGVHHRLLRLAYQLQCAVRRRGRPVQGCQQRLTLSPRRKFKEAHTGKFKARTASLPIPNGQFQVPNVCNLVLRILGIGEWLPCDAGLHPIHQAPLDNLKVVWTTMASSWRPKGARGWTSSTSRRARST